MRGKLALQVGLVILAVTLCGTFRPESPAQAQSSSAAPSLYKRLGGYDAIAAVTDDFLGRLAADKQMSRFFVGVSADSLRKVRQHVVDQLCEASGGPCYYFGRSMFIAAYTLWDKRAVSHFAITPLVLDWGANVGRAIFLTPFALKYSDQAVTEWHASHRAPQSA